MPARDAAKRLLRWYDRHARELPWRGSADPYVIWVSEVMLQQTTVGAVAPYFIRFMTEFPTLDDLARAPLDRVMKAWEGLGYYSRAVNLHRAARVLAHEWGGRYPDTEEGWRALPGVGAYTAAAIAAIGFGRRTLAVDGLVRRVLFRYYALPAGWTSARIDKEIRARGLELLAPRRPGDGVQALMDLATDVCRPKAPRCEHCPLGASCVAHADGDAERLPARARPARKKVDVAVGLWIRGGRVFLQRRGESGLFAGLWELPGGKVEPGESAGAAVVREFAEETEKRVRVVEALPTVKHAYTTFDVTLHPFIVAGSGRVPAGDDRGFIPLGEIERYAQPAANARIWRDYFRRHPLDRSR